MNQEIIEILMDEFTPLMKKSNLIIIFTFALAVLILLIYFLILFIIPRHYVTSSYYVLLIFILDLVLWGVTTIMVFWRINRVLAKLGLFGVYGRYNDF